MRIVVQWRKIVPAQVAGERHMDMMAASRPRVHHPARRSRVLVRMVTLATSFAATALLLHLLIDNPRQLYAEERSEKLALLHKWSHDIDVVAVGTSRVEEGFDPAVFDATFTTSGQRTNSFNLGLPGGSQSEQRFTGLEALSALQSSNARSDRLLLLELNAGINFPPEDVLHPRSIDLYDMDTIRFSYRFGGDEGAVKQLGRLGFALVAGVAHYANAGMLSAIVFRSKSADNPEVALAATHGQRITPASAQDRQGVAEAFSARIAPTQPAPVSLAPGNLHLIADLAYAAPATSAHPVQLAYVVTPTLADRSSAAIYPDEIRGPNGPVPIINMARPDRYPELYQQANWRNTGHLNKAGAALFTRLLAQQLDAWLRRHEAR
jgi:hypothetical protein